MTQAAGYQAPFNPQRERAARLCAIDDLTDVEIAREVGITPRTLWRWKATDEFRLRIESIRDELAEDIRREGIGNRKNRVGMLDDLAQRLFQLIEARGRVMGSNPNVIGGALGLLAESQRVLGQGRNAQVVTEYQYDSAVVRDIALLLKQGASEMGQWQPGGERSPATALTAFGQLPAEGMDHRTLLYEEVLMVRRRLIASGVPVLDTGADGQVVVDIDPVAQAEADADEMLRQSEASAEAADGTETP